MEDISFLLVLQLRTAAPTLLVYLIGMILALVFWRGCPKANLLCLLGLGLLFMTGIVQLVASLLIRSMSVEKAVMLSDIMSVFIPLARAAGTALLLGAIFTGRKGKHIAVDQPTLVRTATSTITRSLSSESIRTEG